MGKKKSIIFLYQYELGIILKKYCHNDIYLLCRVIIEDYGNWCSIFVGLIPRLAADAAANIATRLISSGANSGANSRAARLTASEANGWALTKTNKRNSEVNSRTARLTTGGINNWALGNIGEKLIEPMVESRDLPLVEPMFELWVVLIMELIELIVKLELLEVEQIKQLYEVVY